MASTSSSQGSSCSSSSSSSGLSLTKSENGHFPVEEHIVIKPEPEKVANGHCRALRRRRRPAPLKKAQPRACTPPPPPEDEEEEETPRAVTPSTPPPKVGKEDDKLMMMVKSPPTPHKIQSLDEKSLRLDENYLAFSPTKPAAKSYISASINAKPLNSTLQNKTVKFLDGETRKKDKPSLDAGPGKKEGRKGTRLNGTTPKLTDYFVQRRSNRKTQETIQAEKHQLLVKAIVEGHQDGLTVKSFNGKGRGVVATKPFLRHEFVVEYAGELLTSVEARKREAKYAKDTGTGCYMYYFQYNNQQYCVDATKESDRLGRLVNHSRNGNLVTKVVEVKGNPRLILIAKRDIDIDEELCYDYGDRSREALEHHPWLAN